LKKRIGERQKTRARMMTTEMVETTEAKPMPEGYLKIRAKLYRQCLEGKPPSERNKKRCREKAKRSAAKIWNSQHPDNPVGRGME
jgi:hypothetical protein